MIRSYFTKRAKRLFSRLFHRTEWSHDFSAHVSQNSMGLIGMTKIVLLETPAFLFILHDEI